MRALFCRQPVRSICASLLGLVSVVALGACSQPPTEVPAELLGTWVTRSPSHADRIFVVRPDSIVFGTSAYTRETYSLASVEPMEPSDGWRSFRLTYRELDAEISDIEIAYRVGATRELRFSNRPEIWRPEGAIPNPAKAPAPSAKKSIDAWMARERGDG